MAELTKEYFDQQLNGLVTKTDLETAFETAFDKQAVFINNAFQANQDYMDRQFATKLDIESVKDELKTDISRVEAKVDKALHTEYVNLEVRVKRIERKLELKPL